MQSYGEFLPTPRKIPDSSPTYMDKRHIVGHIVETGQKVVQRDTTKGCFCVNLHRFSKDQGDRSLIFYFERGRDSGVKATSVFSSG
jgi:hypothetical protein